MDLVKTRWPFHGLIMSLVLLKNTLAFICSIGSKLWFDLLSVVSVFVLSCLDYCSSLLSSCPQCLQNKLQKSRAVLLALSQEFPNLTISVLILLLSTGCSLIYEYHTNIYLCYNCLNWTIPTYLTELLKVYKPTCQLCSSFCAHALAWSEIFYSCCIVCL